MYLLAQIYLQINFYIILVNENTYVRLTSNLEINFYTTISEDKLYKQSSQRKGIYMHSNVK